MIRFHPSILLTDLWRAAECIGCVLTTDTHGRLMVIPLPEAQPINPERHGNLSRACMPHHDGPLGRALSAAKAVMI